jgi:predicted RNA-binding protein
VISDLSEKDLIEICQRAETEGLLRTLVEATSSLDPFIADVLHRLDRRAPSGDQRPIAKLPLTGWQSYGRPEVLAFNKRVEEAAIATKSVAVLLPCARRRPYQFSRTHKRIWKQLNSGGIFSDKVDQVVVSSIGVVPMSLWDDRVVAVYDSGVPDIYRVLRLMRLFFRKASYTRVIDCLEFPPYSDCLAIVSQEGLIGEIVAGPPSRERRLPCP